MRHSLLIFTVFLLASSMLTSCRTYYEVSMANDYTNAFVGKSHNDVVCALGAPDRETSDGAGGTILIYEDYTSQSVATASNVNYLTGTYTPGARTTAYTDYVHLYINPEGVCYNVNTNHTKEVSSFSPGKTIGLISAIVGPVTLMLIALLAGSSY